MNNNNTNINKVTFGKLTLEGRSGIPTLELKVGDRSFYLTPFRAYRFQVSGSKDGDGDYGSSPVIHSRESFKELPRTITTGIIDSAARDAIYRFCEGGREIPFIGTMTNVYYEFLDESHKWLWGTKSNYMILDEDRTVEDRTDKRILVW
jgi:hypothetical protein